ncbi:AimR family lysis-lysogeny pheromone receptor [Bacillus suaedaesalsae]|uniref:AimR family lysis-lysogeny pheromone receptor n=1 Tax=Bacillus suaedaesalsae TaxID=2810349 RepID=A0ABS2DDK6_9BACI|nr:AimR family lysis-lysogeny pheromone receptor [Bacillus suaedaesalsae]MBM6616540.1 AimR family lysis-lysogeny pheromone receptor [Bacillus suaedaesalsae]
MSRENHTKLPKNGSTNLLIDETDSTNEPDFCKSISLVEEIYENDFTTQKSKLIELITNSTSFQTRRLGMEYYITQGEAELLESLIESEKESTDPLNREWAYTYEILLKKNKGLLYGDRLNETVLSMKSTSKETHLLLCILHMFGVYQAGQYESFFKVSEAILPEVQQIEDTFIRNSYELHLLELYCFSHLLMNQIDACRNKAMFMIEKAKANRFPISAINAYHNLAHSYMFESFDKAVQYLDQGQLLISLLPEDKAANRQRELNKTRDFLRSLWKKELETTPEDIVERAHRYIVRGEKEKGLRILDEIKIKQGNNLSAFQWYYYALGTGKEEHFLRAKQIFSAKKDKFFIQVLKNT